MEETSWPSRRRWKGRVGYGDGCLEIRSLGSSIRGNMMDGGWSKSPSTQQKTAASLYSYEEKEDERGYKVLIKGLQGWQSLVLDTRWCQSHRPA